jgi:hypothetical protein
MSVSEETSNGSTAAALRRRVKNEKLRDKILEIKAHQKESEAMRGIYRSIPGRYLFYFLAFGIVGACSFYYYNRSS